MITPDNNPIRIPKWAKIAAKEYVQELWAPSVRTFKARQKIILSKIIAKCFADAMKK